MAACGKSLWRPTDDARSRRFSQTKDLHKKLMTAPVRFAMMHFPPAQTKGFATCPTIRSRRKPL
jgi:hypothetical protein